MRRPVIRRLVLTCLLSVLWLCSPAATADEGLFIIGSSFDESRGRFAPQANAFGGATAMPAWPAAETYLYFPATGQKQRNNLIPPTAVGRRVLNWQAYGSTAGRLILMTRSRVDHLTRASQPVFEMRLVSPFRNLPFTQTTPFYRLAEGKAGSPVVISPNTVTDNGLAPYVYSLQWAPDGSGFTLINQHGRLGSAGENEVRDLGGGLLYTFTGSPRFRTGTVENTLMRPGPQRGETAQFAFPSKRGRYDAGTFARRGQRSFAQFSDLSPVHLSPNGRYVARVETVRRPQPGMFNQDKQILKLGRLEHPGQVFELDRSSTLVRGGAGSRWRDEKGYSQLIPIGWSQESDYFYFTELKAKRRAFDVRDQGGAWVNTAGRNFREPAGANTYVIDSVVLWRSNTDGLVRKVMDLDHVPSTHHLQRRMSPTLVSEGKRYVAFWATPRSRFAGGVKYKQWSMWRPDNRHARDLHLVVADTTAKTERRVFHSGTMFDYASFINTQDHDTNNPQPAFDDNKLPQYFLKFKTAPRLSQVHGTPSILMPFEGKAIDLEGKHDKFKIYIRAVDERGKLLPSVDRRFRGAKGEALIVEAMTSRRLTIEGTHFQCPTAQVALAHLDLFGDAPRRVRLRISLEREGKEMVNALSDPVDIPVARLPSVFFGDVQIERGKDPQTGEPAIVYRATVHLRGHRGATIKLYARAYRLTAEGRYDRAIAKDTTWLADSGEVTAWRRLRVDDDVLRHRLEKVIPLSVFASGKNRTWVYCDFLAVDQDARKVVGRSYRRSVKIWP